MRLLARQESIFSGEGRSRFVTYSVRLTKLAEKQLRKLPEQVWDKLLILETFPEKGELLAGSEESLRSLHFTVKGSGQYRAIYIIEDNLVCLVAFIGTRENFYDRFARFRSGS